VTKAHQLTIRRALHVTLLNAEVGVATLAAVVYTTVFAISKSFIINYSDFKGFVLSANHSREALQLLPGATADFQRGLGISEYPVSLLFDLPWLLATSVPVTLLQIVFGLSTCMSLYIAVNALGKFARLTAPVRQVAGFTLPILMFLPGPIKWNSVATYTASFGWTVSTLTIALTLLMMSPRWSLRVNVPLGAICGGFVFWGNASYLPMTLPPVLLAAIFAIWARHHRSDRIATVSFAASMLVPALAVLPLFLGTYLFGVWAIPEVAVQENIDQIVAWSELPRVILPFPGLSNLPILSQFVSGTWLQILALVVLLVSIRHAYRHGQRRMAQLATFALGIFFTYATTYFVAAKLLRREIGLSPSYIEIVAYPIWLLLIVGLLFAFVTARVRVPTNVLRVVPIILIVFWGLQWVVRNNTVHLQPREYPILLSETTRELQQLTTEDRNQGVLSRVIILQEQFSSERLSEGFRIRRATDFSYSFLLELQSANVPVLNAYSHMISPRTFKLTNQLFSDGRPSWRQFSLYDKFNLEASIALGIRYVLSEYAIEDARLTPLSAHPFVSYRLFPTGRQAFLYKISPQPETSDISLRYRFEKDRLRVTASSTEPQTLLVPIEFSRCLTFDSQDGAQPTVTREESYGLTNITFVGDLNLIVRYENSILQWQNCRIRDYLDFRRQPS
jgi:hypothetical protein